MKNVMAQTGLENPILKKIDDPDVINYSSSDNYRFLYVDHKRPLENEFNLFCKRSFDLLVSSLLILFLFSWIFPLIALLIKIESKGPVFFLQKRNKKDGALFLCIKFRTMAVNLQADILPAAQNDQRITGIGNFLRKYHLDELPQLFNVWWGDMSMIGPRPYMLVDNQKYEAIIGYYRFRHTIKPGLTGPAQLLRYDSELSEIQKMHKRTEMDFHYVRNWSMKLDVLILFRTILKMVGLNSYTLNKIS
jgi:putative colanic acid biosynthesis UDP-glucose lipid carrier transferase